jgi:tellurite resistance protein
MAAAKKGPNLAYLEEQADVVKAGLAGDHQAELFKLAVEAGYLAALADGEEDTTEREALVEAIESLSKGLVIEWETEALLGEVAARLSSEGAAARAIAIGERLKTLGQAEAALLVGALVAHASGGVDKKEAATLQKIANAAGLQKDQIVAIVKKARA